MRSTPGNPAGIPRIPLRAKTHHPLYPRAVVPASIEKHHFAGCRQVGGIALEIPLRLLAFRRSRQGDHAADTRVQRLGDPFDGPTLSSTVPALEDDDHLEPFVAYPFLELRELHL